MKSEISLSIINKPSTIFFKGCLSFYLKRFIRKTLDIKRGPDVVLQSLIRGLDELSFHYNINPVESMLAETVHVISNPIALKWAIEQKKAGKIKKLITGPNISILPSYDDEVLCDTTIDLILLPSEWTKKAYIECRPQIENRLRIWSSGVKVPDLNYKSSSEKKLLVFKKQIDMESFDHIKAVLDQKKASYKVISYGSFNQSAYFDLLAESAGMIYLQEVESQGLALQEAWARNIPTLVWNKGYFIYPTGQRVEGNISAPLLTPQTGMFFQDADQFPQALDEFLAKITSFSPREHVIKHLSDKVSAENYIKFI